MMKARLPIFRKPAPHLPTKAEETAKAEFILAVEDLNGLFVDLFVDKEEGKVSVVRFEGSVVYGEPVGVCEVWLGMTGALVVVVDE